MQPEFVSTFRVKKTLNMIFRSVDISAETREKIEKTIDNIPKADVAPIIHAHWRDVYDDYGTARCTCCGSDYDVTGEKSDAELFAAFCEEYKYCPSCGAKMDEEET